jgi:hypothetical protein
MPTLSQPSLDPTALNLTKAIALQEGGGKYLPYDYKSGDEPNAPAGTAGGRYQFIAGTWKNYAKQILGDANAPMTDANQNQVAYTKIKSFLDSGKTAAQAASMWNAGEGSPDSWKPGTVQKHGNTPQYVQNVYKYMQQVQNGQTQLPGTQLDTSGGGGDTSGADSPFPTTKLQIPDSLSANSSRDNSGFLSNISKDISGTNPDSYGTQAVNALKGAGNFLFPIAGDVYHDIKGDNSKTALQQAGDLGSSALSAATLIPGLGEGILGAKAALMGAKAAEGAKVATGVGLGADGLGGILKTGESIAPIIAKAKSGLASRLGKNAVLGAAFSTTQGLGAGDTDAGKLAQDAGAGAVTGGLVGGAGEILSKITSTLPQRLVSGVIKNSNPEVAKYALTKPLGSPAKMLADSDASLKDIGTKLGAALTHSNVADVVVPSNQIIPKIVSQFPNAELTSEALQGEINKIAPLQKALTKKLFSGEGLSIDELHTLNSAIGQNTYKMAFDDPQVKAGKAIGNAFYQASKDIITTAAPDTVPLFDQYSREIQLNGALEKTLKRGSKGQVLTLRDIMSMLGGYAALGPGGALGGYLLEKGATSPTINMKAAGLINKASKMKGLVNPAILGSTGLVGGAFGQGGN